MEGSYALVIHLKNDRKITIGKLGSIAFKKGYYVYIGSALNGLEQRIARHKRSRKKIRWHIDYLLQHATIVTVFYKESNEKEECSIAQIFHENLESIPGFGCSDCSCESHLFYGNRQEIEDILSSLSMIKANH